MFGRVQAKLFPQYFATATAAVVLQMGTLAFGSPIGIPRPQLIVLGNHLFFLWCCTISNGMGFHEVTFWGLSVSQSLAEVCLHNVQDMLCCNWPASTYLSISISQFDVCRLSVQTLLLDDQSAEEPVQQWASCGCVAGVALLSTVINWLYIEPVATDLMFERYALENAEGERDGQKIKALYKQFGTSLSHQASPLTAPWAAF